MLRYSNYVTYGERATTAARTFVGGDIIAILLRQGMRLKALRDARARTLNRSVEAVGNPTVFVADIPVNTIKQEAFNYTADATRFPVESGAVISDHVILQPLRIDISFEVSNWEMATASYALDLLEALWALRVPIDLMTYYKKIPNMVMTNLQASNSVPEWGKLSARASFQQIGMGVLEVKGMGRERVSPTEKTGGPDTEQSALPPENNKIISPKKSTIKKLWEKATE